MHHSTAAAFDMKADLNIRVVKDIPLRVYPAAVSCLPSDRVFLVYATTPHIFIASSPLCPVPCLYAVEPGARGYVMTSLASRAWFSPCPWDERRAIEALLEALLRLRLPDFLRPGIAGPEGRCPDRLVTVNQ